MFVCTYTAPCSARVHGRDRSRGKVSEPRAAAVRRHRQRPDPGEVRVASDLFFLSREGRCHVVACPGARSRRHGLKVAGRSAKVTADSKGKEDGDEARHDRARPHGWKHGPAARAGRPRGGHVHAVRRRHSLHDRGAGRELEPPRGLDDGAGGRRDRDDLHHAARPARAGRCHRRRRQLELPRLQAPPRGGARKGSLRDVGVSGRHLGPRGRLLPDGRGRRRTVADRQPAFATLAPEDGCAHFGPAAPATS